MMRTFNLGSSMSDRENFDDMVRYGAALMLSSLPFNEGQEDDAWLQDPNQYAKVAFENFKIVAVAVESGEEAPVIVDDIEEAKARYAAVFPQAVRSWQKETMIDHLTEEVPESGHRVSINITLGGQKDGFNYGPVTIDIVILDTGGDQIAYRQSDDGSDGDWKIGGIEDAVEEALGVREQLATLEAELAEDRKQAEILAAL
jgi:hypothetical protein